MQTTFLSLSLIPCGDTSYNTNDLAGLCGWLLTRGFFTLPVRNPRIEYTRIANGAGALVVFYISGAVVVQGKNQNQTRALLNDLAEADCEACNV